MIRDYSAAGKQSPQYGALASDIPPPTTAVTTTVGGNEPITSTTTTTTTSGVDNTNYNAANNAASDVKNAFFWQLPALTLTLAKLFLRVQRIGMKRTRFFRCLGVAVAQYLARVPLMSFATMLPQSDSELVFCTFCIIVDKTSDAYLMYHTWPIPDVLSEAGISVPASPPTTK